MQSVQEFKDYHSIDLQGAKSRKVITYDKVGDPVMIKSIIDKLIEFHGDKSSKLDLIGDLTDAKRAWINGLIAINVRYHRNDSEYNFVKRIMNKLHNCNQINKYSSDERLISIYQALIDGEKLESILDKFSNTELGVYGW